MYELEREFIASIIMKPDLIMTSPIKPSDIQTPSMREIYKAIIRITSQDLIPDSVLLFRECPEYVTDITNLGTPVISNFKKIEDELTEDIRRRRLEVASREFESLLKAGASNDEITASVEALISSSVVEHEHSDIRSFYECAMEFGPILEKRHSLKGSLVGIPSGLPKLDELTGGFQPGTYYIGARPSQGKTALMLSMMRAALHSGHGAGLISIESSDMELISRVLSAEGPIQACNLKSGSLSKSEFNGLRDSLARLKGMNGRIYFNTKTDTAKLENIARRMIKTYGIEILFIDYLQRINAPGFKKFEQVTEASRVVTDIAKGMGVPVVCLAQTGRQADSEQPGLSHFQHSSAIEQDADVAMVITHTKDEASLDKTEESWLNVLKNRDGAVGNVPVYFDRAHVRFQPREAY